MDKNSRSSVEMNNTSDLYANDAVFVCFPIWWYMAPAISNTFPESYDFSGKIIIPLATSGGSGMGKTNEGLERAVLVQN